MGVSIRQLENGLMDFLLVFYDKSSKIHVWNIRRGSRDWIVFGGDVDLRFGYPGAHRGSSH